VKLLAPLDVRISRLREQLVAAASSVQHQVPTREQDPQRRQFYQAGLHLLDDSHPANCPFCAAASLTPARVAAIREAVAESPEGRSAIAQALDEVRGAED
jgi:hypothetical protein